MFLKQFNQRLNFNQGTGASPKLIELKPENLQSNVTNFDNQVINSVLESKSWKFSGSQGTPFLISSIHKHIQSKPDSLGKYRGGAINEWDLVVIAKNQTKNKHYELSFKLPLSEQEINQQDKNIRPKISLEEFLEKASLEVKSRPLDSRNSILKQEIKIETGYITESLKQKIINLKNQTIRS